MSDGLLDETPTVHVVINLNGLMIAAVRHYRLPDTHELAVHEANNLPMVLIWECPTMDYAMSQAEVLWNVVIPARVIDNEVDESFFVASILEG
jgi:hypothetical protein